MMDENDDGARVGLWVVLGIITLLLFGLIFGLGLRAMNAKKAPAPAAAGQMAAGDTPLAMAMPNGIHARPHA